MKNIFLEGKSPTLKLMICWEKLFLLLTCLAISKYVAEALVECHRHL